MAGHKKPPPDEIRCTAHNRRGLRCGRRAIAGGTVCDMHGGGAPHVKLAAARRLTELARKAETGKLTLAGAESLAAEALGAVLADQVKSAADLSRRLIDAREAAALRDETFVEIGEKAVVGDVIHQKGVMTPDKKTHIQQVDSQTRRGGVHPLRAARDAAEERVVATAGRLLDYRLQDRMQSAAVGRAAVVVEIARAAAVEARRSPDDTPDEVAQRVIAQMIANEGGRKSR